MFHSFTITGEAYRIRPIGNEDYLFLWNLRTDPALNQFIHPVDSRPEKQLEWLECYYNRPGDYYFVVENAKTLEKEGTIGLYDIDELNQSGEWGRWLLRQGSLAAVESALLIYKFAFDTLSLNEVFCRTVAKNQKVVSFHESCGISTFSLLKKHFTLRDESYDAVEHRINTQTWIRIWPKLEKMANRIATKLNQ